MDRLRFTGVAENTKLGPFSFISCPDILQNVDLRMVLIMNSYAGSVEPFLKCKMVRIVLTLT